MKRRLLVTGTSGFLGAAVVRRLLREGHQVGALVRPGSRLEHLGGIRDALTVIVHDGGTESLVDALRAFAPQQVLHLASMFLSDHTAADVEGLLRSNLVFPTQLLEAMSAAGCRELVNTGTSWQHFDAAGYRPVNLYAATKQAFEDLLAYYCDARGLSCVTLKLFDTYGPGDRRRKLIRLLMDAARSGERLQMSPGRQRIDLSHSADVAEAFAVAGARVAAAQPGTREDFFVASGLVDLHELVALLEQVGGRRIAVDWGARPYRPREVMMPCPTTGRLLPGWAPRVALADGLRELLSEHHG